MLREIDEHKKPRTNENENEKNVEKKLIIENGIICKMNFYIYLIFMGIILKFIIN